jgi:hypothetical protein
MQDEISVSQMLTIDIKTVSFQDIEAKLGDTMGQVAQLPVETLPVQSKACRVRMVGADSINPSGCSIFFRPGEIKTRGWGWNRGHP